MSERNLELKKQVLEYYEAHKHMKCPIIGNVRLTAQSLWHLENKDKKHKRSDAEIEIRYKCFLSIDKIICNSNLYQEYKQGIESITLKKQGIKIKKDMKVKYFGLVGIIEPYPGHWIRIKVVIKKVQGWGHSEFISVIPARNMKGYHRLYFDEEL